MSACVNFAPPCARGARTPSSGMGGRTRMVKDIVREHGATDREITRAYLRVSAGFYPKACE